MSHFVKFGTLFIRASDICSIEGREANGIYGISITTCAGKTHELVPHEDSKLNLEQCLNEIRADVFDDKNEDTEGREIRKGLTRSLNKEIEKGAALKASERNARGELNATYAKIHQLNDKIALLEAELNGCRDNQTRRLYTSSDVGILPTQSPDAETAPDFSQQKTFLSRLFGSR